MPIDRCEARVPRERLRGPCPLPPPLSPRPLLAPWLCPLPTRCRWWPLPVAPPPEPIPMPIPEWLLPVPVPVPMSPRAAARAVDMDGSGEDDEEEEDCALPGRLPPLLDAARTALPPAVLAAAVLPECVVACALPVPAAEPRKAPSRSLRPSSCSWDERLIAMARAARRESTGAGIGTSA